MARKEMTASDFKELCAYIDKHHSFVRLDGKAIKYVTPTIDMRSGTVFCVRLKGLGGEKTFSITNENKDRDLKTRIIDWLDNGSWGD